MSKTLEQLTGSIVSNYIALHYNEQVSHTGYYKKALKYKLKNAIQELQKAEKEEFDLIYDHEDEVTHQISSNMITFIDEMVKTGFTDMMMIGSMQMAYKKAPGRMEYFVNQILNDDE
jgi:hypothetical protein